VELQRRLPLLPPDRPHQTSAGKVTKSIVDYGVSGGPEPKTRIPRLISDDHHRFVRFSVTGVEIVETLEEEGVLVTVSPVQDV